MGYSRPARDFRTVQWEHAAFLSRDARLLEGHQSYAVASGRGY